MLYSHGFKDAPVSTHSSSNLPTQETRAEECKSQNLVNYMKMGHNAELRDEMGKYTQER